PPLFVSDTMASSSALSKANTTFALAFFKKLSEKDKTTNIFYSPFSISSALAMVMLGAGGNTATQISEVQQHRPFTGSHACSFITCVLCPQCLKTQDCQGDVHVGFAELLSALNKADAPYALSVANRLFGEQSFLFLEDFLTQIRRHYNTELDSVDFKTQSEAAMVKINSWVEKETQGKIKDIVTKGVLNAMTRLVLVNAIYFKGTWDEPFLRIRTHDAQFRLNKKDTKPVRMMRHKTYFPYAFISEANCQILEMPYKGKELSMLIFLPKEMEDYSTGLEKLEKQLTYEKFVEWTRPDRMDSVEVDLELPRFKMEETYDLKDVLTSMGMVDAFDDTKCDLSGISGAKDLVVSKATHKAFVEVNEEGTEAAAATSFYCELQCLNLNLVYFRANHPFLFFIRHKTTMSVLFAGRFCSP
ncbi:hypothetical protein L3Q82_017962, partial [Scortum barcoo]